MNTFEKCQAIRRMIVNRAAEVIAYENWSDEFAAKQIRNFPSNLKKSEKGSDYFDIQPADLTEEEMLDLGFGKWEKENPMRLIPLYLLPFLADEIETESINGKVFIKKSEIDNDNRGGCLAYGVIPKKVQE